MTSERVDQMLGVQQQWCCMGAECCSWGAGEQGPKNVVYVSVVPPVSPSDNLTDLLMGTRFFSEASSGPYKDVNVLQNSDE